MRYNNGFYENQHKKHMKILLVRTSSMGDLIHTLPAIEDLSRNCPDTELHWLCEEAFSDIARLHPFVRKIHYFSWRQWRKKLFSAETWHKIKTLKKSLNTENFDAVLDAQGLIKSALASKLAGAPVVGMDKHSAREALATYFYRQTFPIPKAQNAIWRNRALFASFFNYDFDDKVNFGVRLPEKIPSVVAQQPYHVCLTAASRDDKLWPLENWAALIKKIYDTDGLPCYLPYGNEAERQRAATLAEQWDFIHLCPPMTLVQATILLAQAKSVIGVDTGLLHLANAVECTLLGIFTSTNPQKTGVQPSKYAMNIGKVGEVPDVQAAFCAWQTVSACAIK